MVAICRATRKFFLLFFRFTISDCQRSCERVTACRTARRPSWAAGSSLWLPLWLPEWLASKWKGEADNKPPILQASTSIQIGGLLTSCVRRKSEEMVASRDRFLETCWLGQPLPDPTSKVARSQHCRSLVREVHYTIIRPMAVALRAYLFGLSVSYFITSGQCIVYRSAKRHQ